MFVFHTKTSRIATADETLQHNMNWINTIAHLPRDSAWNKGPKETFKSQNRLLILAMISFFLTHHKAHLHSSYIKALTMVVSENTDSKDTVAQEWSTETNILFLKAIAMLVCPTLDSAGTQKPQGLCLTQHPDESHAIPSDISKQMRYVLQCLSLFHAHQTQLFWSFQHIPAGISPESNGMEQTPTKAPQLTPKAIPMPPIPTIVITECEPNDWEILCDLSMVDHRNPGVGNRLNVSWGPRNFKHSWQFHWMERQDARIRHSQREELLAAGRAEEAAQIGDDRHWKETEPKKYFWDMDPNEARVGEEEEDEWDEYSSARNANTDEAHSIENYGSVCGNQGGSSDATTLDDREANQKLKDLLAEIDWDDDE
ncbi:hypothetical protein EDC01DRAFT_632454 [Geopyxis carbonaria]|nr:hypothetical protein EDC01DRAFT_632454 [Geopyxis carbonaria]